MKATASISIYERDGEEVSGIDRPQVVLERHWNRSSEMVVLIVGKENVTVSRRDLEAAIEAVTVKS